MDVPTFLYSLNYGQTVVDRAKLCIDMNWEVIMSGISVFSDRPTNPDVRSSVSRIAPIITVERVLIVLATLCFSKSHQLVGVLVW